MSISFIISHFNFELSQIQVHANSNHCKLGSLPI